MSVLLSRSVVKDHSRYQASDHAFVTVLSSLLLLCRLRWEIDASWCLFRAVMLRGQHEDYLSAAESFQKASRLESSQPKFYAAQGLAAAYIALGNNFPDEPWKALPSETGKQREHLLAAEQNYIRAISLAEYDSELWSNLGWVNAYLKDDEKALQAFRHATMINPNDYIARVGAGLCFERMGAPDKAAEQYVYALASSPSIVDSPFFTTLRSRNPALTQIIVTRALDNLSFGTSSPITLALIARLHTYEGRYALARSEYIGALHSLPNLPYTWTNLGLLDVSVGKLNEASSDFQRALFLDPQDAVAANGLAAVRFTEGDMSEAEDSYARGIRETTRSGYADRSEAVYHLPSIDSSETVPGQLLDYLSLSMRMLPLCEGWLSELRSITINSSAIRKRLQMQVIECNGVEPSW